MRRSSATSSSAVTSPDPSRSASAKACRSFAGTARRAAARLPSPLLLERAATDPSRMSELGGAGRGAAAEGAEGLAPPPPPPPPCSRSAGASSPSAPARAPPASPPRATSRALSARSSPTLGPHSPSAPSLLSRRPPSPLASPPTCPASPSAPPLRSAGRGSSPSGRCLRAGGCSPRCPPSFWRFSSSSTKTSPCAPSTRSATSSSRAQPTTSTWSCSRSSLASPRSAACRGCAQQPSSQSTTSAR
mmetsp:Transcript_19571/g.64741  ORF Transcript_19571/g.64741 Transcript_19571/m.64741 type:complete len:246 (+) Transcript_19571:925-1662(+)